MKTYKNIRTRIYTQRRRPHNPAPYSEDSYGTDRSDLREQGVEPEACAALIATGGLRLIAPHQGAANRKVSYFKTKSSGGQVTKSSQTL